MKLNRRGWTSAILAGSITLVVISAALAYSIAWNSVVASLHTFAGVIFIVVLIMHLTNNFKSLTNYFSGNKAKLFSIIVAGMLFALISAAFKLPPLYYVFDFGLALRGQAEVDEGTWTKITSLNNLEQDRKIQLAMQAGPRYQSDPVVPFIGDIKLRTVPQMVIWIEDLRGNYIETLYATAKVATNGWQSTPWGNAPDLVRRPESLPVWAHSRGKKYADGLLFPTEENPLPDGISSATPQGSFELVAAIPDEAPQQVKIRLEVNSSFDYNEFWKKDSFPDDPVYSSGGNSAQPSLVYEGILDLSKPDSMVVLNVVGHGDRSGRNGDINLDLSTFTTALKQLNWVVVKAP